MQWILLLPTCVALVSVLIGSVSCFEGDIGFPGSFRLESFNPYTFSNGFPNQWYVEAIFDE